MEQATTKEGTWLILTEAELKTICRIGQGDDTCKYITMSEIGMACCKQTDMVKDVAERVKGAKGEGSWPGCPWEDKSVVIFNCLKCGKELVQTKNNINIKIQYGIVCPYCHNVTMASDYVALARREV